MHAPSERETPIGEDTVLPVFTSREEEIEFASQPAEEIVAAEADVLGLTGDMAKAGIGDEVGNALMQLEAELTHIPYTAKAAYLEAMQRCPEQVDNKHKNAFLYREDYNTKLAAKRLVKYWEHRRVLFGEERCYLPFTLAGALQDDRVALKNCVLCVLPDKDNNGRVIVYWKLDRYLDTELCSEESMRRACWYTLHKASQDTTVQERGFVILFWPSPLMVSSAGQNWQLFKTHAELIKGVFALEQDFLPIVIRGIHWCKPSRLFHLVGPMLKYVLGKRLRGRFKVHYGSDEKVLNNLDEYGIPRKLLPTELGGDVELCHDQWILPPDPISNETKLSSMINDQRVGNLTAVVKSDQEINSRLGELETASLVARKSNRQKHACDEHNTNAERKSAIPSSTILSANERRVSDDAVLNGTANKRKIAGRKGDPRMNLAVLAKLNNPALSTENALLAGGFVFPQNIDAYMTDKTLFDADGVCLEQRKHQFRRRLRIEKKKALDSA